MAVERVLGGRMTWYSEFEKHPSTLLATRFPGIPNLGDLTKIDWSAVPPVDILTGGYPCQPFSQAGKRLGEDDPRHLWPFIREAIRVLRPKLAILENVSGHRSKGFSTVLRDCAEDGLHARWVSVRASDVGAPHQRERLFFIVTDPDGAEWEQWRQPVTGGEEVPSADECLSPLPTVPLLATPQARDSKGAQKDGFCNASLPRDIQNLPHGRWGRYEPAVQRWSAITRPAPCPVEPGRGGKPRVRPEFSEWMMGIPEGWVTSPRLGIPRIDQLKLLGNGVVPPQAELALIQLLHMQV